MKCPHCGREFKDEGRAKGGRAHSHSKGFGSPEVLAKALATRAANARAKRSLNKAICATGGSS